MPPAGSWNPPKTFRLKPGRRVSQDETENIDEVLRKEAAARFNLDPDVDSIDYINVGTVRQGDEVKNEYILFAADGQTIRSHIEMLELAGLRPVGLDPVACALFRSYRRFFRRQEDKEQAEVFVDVGSLFTTVVFGRNSDIGFVKHIPIGTELFNKEIASRLGISPAEAETLRNRISKRNQMSGTSGLHEKTSPADSSAGADDDASTRQVISEAIGAVCEKLAKEISLCFRYYTVTFRSRRAQRAIFSGGGSYETILLGVLAKYLTVEIDVAHPLNGMDMTGVDFGADRRGSHCEWAMAVGLALKGSNAEKSRSPVLAAQESIG